MSLTMNKTLMSAAVAALLGVGLAGAGTTVASADTIRTRCVGDDCYRVQCNDWGYDCVDIGYRQQYDRPYRSRYICDADGDDCHWSRTYDYDRDYDRDDYPY